MGSIKDIVPTADKVVCHNTGDTVPLQVCRQCPYYEFDGAVAALGEWSFTFDTSLDVQSPHICHCG